MRPMINSSSSPFNVPHPSTSPLAEDEVDIRALFLVFWRKKILILAIVLGCVSAVFIALQFVQPRYNAHALILIEPESTPAAAMLGEGAVPPGMPALPLGGAPTQNEVEVLRSRIMAEALILKLQLFNDPEFNPYLDQMHGGGPLEGNLSVPALQSGSSITGGAGFKSLTLYKSSDLAQGGQLSPVARAHMEAVATTVLKHITVSPVGGSSAIKIMVQSSNPEKAARIANAYTDLYIQRRQEERFQTHRHLTQWLGERLKTLQGQIEEKEEALVAYNRDHNLEWQMRPGSPSESPEQYRITELKSQQSMLDKDTAQLRARIETVRQMQGGGADAGSMKEILDSPLIQTLKADEIALSRRLTDLKGRYGPKHPVMINLKKELQNLRGKIEREMTRVLDQMEHELGAVEMQRKTIETQIDQMESALQSRRPHLIYREKLMQDLEMAKMTYNAFLETYKRTDQREKLQKPGVQILSYAFVPDKPVYPRRLLLLAVAGMFSFVVALIVALFLEKLNNSFRSARHLENSVGFPCIGLIPVLDKKSRGELAQYILDKPSSTLAESVRALRMVINLRAKDSEKGTKPQVITMTSSMPGEGKSSLSCWFARLAAKSGERVILIDADLRRPSIHKLFDRENTVSLVDCLTGKAEWKETLVEDATGLHVIFAQSVPNTALDLIGSPAMQDLITDLRNHYDLIVIDSPACLAVSDARVLASYSDLTLYNVAWNETGEDLVQGGIKQFTDIGYRNMFTVLTKVDVKRHLQYGYGDTVYYYGE